MPIIKHASLIFDETQNFNLTFAAGRRDANSLRQREPMITWYRMFSRDVTAAMLVFLNNGTAAVLVYPTNPPGMSHFRVSQCGVSTKHVLASG